MRRPERKTVTTWQPNRYTFAVRGPWEVIYEAARVVDAQLEWSHALNAYRVPAAKIDGLLFAISGAGHHVVCELPRWSA